MHSRSLGKTLLCSSCRSCREEIDPQKIIQYAMNLCAARIPNPDSGDVDLVRNLQPLIVRCREKKLCDDKLVISMATMLCEMTDWKTCGDILALASIYSGAGDFADALKWATKASELAPEDKIAASWVDYFRQELTAAKKKKP